MALSRIRMSLISPLRNLLNPSVRSFSRKKLGVATELDTEFVGDPSSQVGRCMPVGMMRIGTILHSLEMRPGQGVKLVRAPGATAKLVSEPSMAQRYCIVQLPSKDKKLIDKRCMATVGTLDHGFVKKKLYKAGQNRWRGIRPTVRGVAKNPCDHPHGGGEGKSKSSGSHGRTSCTPWGKPTKCGYKSPAVKKRKRLALERMEKLKKLKKL